MTRQVFFTSDPHWGHANVIRYSNRPFADVDEMNRGLVANWNATVQPEDTVYLLGDVAFLPADKIESIIKSLHGRKHLIYGNHDKTIRNQRGLQALFESVSDYKEVTIEKQHIVMCHYPMITWNRGHHGSWMLHGHSHGSCKYPQPNARILDVGVDVHGYTPISFEHIKRLFNGRDDAVHHGD